MMHHRSEFTFFKIKIKTFQIFRLYLPFMFFTFILQYSTDYYSSPLNTEEFALNGRGQPDIDVFDFTNLYSATHACRIKVHIYFLNPYPTLNFIKKLESKPRPFYPVLQINLLMSSFLEAMESHRLSKL